MNRRILYKLFKTFLLVSVLVFVLGGAFYAVFEKDIVFLSNIFEEVRFSFKRVSLGHFNPIKVQGITLTDRQNVVGCTIEEALVDFETINIFSKRKMLHAVFSFETVASILNLNAEYVNNGSLVESYLEKFLENAIDEDLVSIIIDPSQKYNVSFRLLFSENDYLKISNFKAVSADVKIAGEYEYYNDKDMVHVEVFISFSPKITEKHSDLISRYRLEKDDKGWYGFVYEITGPAAFIRGVSGLLVGDK